MPDPASIVHAYGKPQDDFNKWGDRPLAFEDAVLSRAFSETKMVNYSTEPNALFSLEQQVSITGAVSDESEVPIPCISVIEKGTTNGTVTDFDENYP